METIKTISLKNNKVLKIIHDENPINPREDGYIPYTKMLCFHNGWNLGDDNLGYDQNDYASWSELESAIIKKERPLIIKELHLYDHSGIAISTNPFECRWDSGQIGFVWVSQDRIDDIGCHMQDIETWQDYITRLDQYLESEVSTYNDYVQGNTYGFNIEDQEGNIEDSCFGFYGDDFSKNGLYDNVGSELMDSL